MNLARIINQMSGGQVVSPWDVYELPEDDIKDIVKLYQWRAHNG